MTKQEEIEEIAKVLPSIEVVRTLYSDFSLAEWLYDSGCRKIQKNLESICNKYDKEIDMLEKINTELQELNENYYNEAKYLRRELKQARKETAKEILILLGKGFDETKMTEFKNLPWYKLFCRELKQRYGVEVEK